MITIEEVIARLNYKAANIRAKLEPEYFSECVEAIEQLKREHNTLITKTVMYHGCWNCKRDARNGGNEEICANCRPDTLSKWEWDRNV